MKKTVGIVSSLAAVALAGTGMYMMMSNDTKKQMTKAFNSAKNDACKMIDKTVDNMNKNN